MINHLKIWKKRLGENLSEEEMEFAFNHFESSLFVNIAEINNQTKYKPKDKYRSFIKNKRENYLQELKQL